MGIASGGHYVFGYGSLVGPGEVNARVGDGGQPTSPSLQPAVLQAYRRTWNVAMDNSRSIPGYKRYLDPATGEPAPCFVVFLNIVADPGRQVNGALFAVSARHLATLDRRERNYRRIDVSAHLVTPVQGTVWTYTGSPEAVERFDTGRRTGRAVISKAYWDGVRGGFSALGVEAAAQFDALTDPLPCPVVALERVPVPVPEA